ncbi:unnamed protein product, partial [Aureobasidium mustum]
DSGWAGESLLKRRRLPNLSNVARISRAIKSEDSEHHAQIVYYQVGAETELGWWNHIVGGGTDLRLYKNIEEAYRFLANNYTSGDSIFLIGFSRGSFIARSVGELICQLGLLNKKGLPYFDEIFYDWQHAGHPSFKESKFWDHYRDEKKVDQLTTPSDDPLQAKAYLKEYRALLRNFGLIHTVPVRENSQQDVFIRAIAVWETVGALGIPVNPWFQPGFLHEFKRLNTMIPDNVLNAFQALALDEHRALFSPAVWHRPEGCQTTHADIGGSRHNTTMADITLSWMMDQLSGEGTRLKDRSVPDRKDWIEFYDDYMEIWPAYPPAHEWALGA